MTNNTAQSTPGSGEVPTGGCFEENGLISGCNTGESGGAEMRLERGAWHGFWSAPQEQ